MQSVAEVTWKWLRDDHVLHHNVRDLRLDLHSFPGQLSKDLLTEQNVLSRLQLDMPGLRTWVATRQQPSILKTAKEGKVTKTQENPQ